MQYVVLPDEVWPAIDATAIVTDAGADGYARGVQTCTKVDVTRMRWDRGRSELHRELLGARACYQTVAYFQPAGEAVIGVRAGPLQLPG